MSEQTIKHKCGLTAFDMNAGTNDKPRYVYDKDDVDHAISERDTRLEQLQDAFDQLSARYLEMVAGLGVPVNNTGN